MFINIFERVVEIGVIRYLWALFWGKVLLTSINEAKWLGILAIVLFIMGVRTKDMAWLPLSIRPVLCAALFMLVGQKAREAGPFDKGALPPALWICALMTWLCCSALYGQLYMVSNTYQHGAIDVIGGICGAAILIKLSGLASERLPGATRPPRLDREEHASAILHTPRRAQRCPVERSFYLVRRAFDCGLADHAGGSCRGLERIDGGVVCTAEGGVRRWFFARAKGKS